MMQISNDDFNKLKELEESLWIAETRFDNAYMENILSPDFFEFGRSGRVYIREETLSVTYQEINVIIPLKKFQVHSITKDVVLVTYISEVQCDNVELGNRSSLWIKTADGWKLKFHQGTPITK